MEPPETIDEWTAVLTAFKEQLGIKYPLTLLNSDHAQLMVASAYNVTGANNFYLEGDTVKYGPLEPGYEQYLKTMNEWYSKGLIDPDFAVQDSKTFDAKVASGEAGAYFNSVGGGMGKYCRGAVMGPMIQDARYFEQYQQTPEQKETAQIWNLSDTDWQMPPMPIR